MVRPRESREKRLCLACGGSTRVSHLGLDLCRACAVFHRRSTNRDYACRSTTGDCPRGSPCRKCRFNRIDRMLATAPPPVDIPPSVEERQESEERTNYTPLLTKLDECYKIMCETRLIAELSSRSPPTHPMEMNDDEFTPIPATPEALNNANRIFLSSILKFGQRAFPEFSEFREAQKRCVVFNFFHRFRLFEAGFRADRRFPEDMYKSFGSYTSFVSEEVAQTFYSDASANRMMADSLRKDLRPNRERFRRLKLGQEEFISILVLMFWNTGLYCPNLSKKVREIGERYKAVILDELHNYYKNEMNLDNYAPRLGEVMMFIDIYSQLSTELNHKYELLRMSNVFSEDTVLYKSANPKK